MGATLGEVAIAYNGSLGAIEAPNTETILIGVVGLLIVLYAIPLIRSITIRRR